MEKILLKEKGDLKLAIQAFGHINKRGIEEVVNEYPCILIGHFSEDIEFGNGYSFTTVKPRDFDCKAGDIYTWS